jgi:hypothetical protein
VLRRRARRDAAGPAPAEITPPAFIVGCGRSGTTILGKLFTEHPEVTYLREPYHLWAAVDRRADVTGLHVVTPDVRFFLDEGDRTEEAQRRFDRLIPGAARPGTRVIEKTPHNAARIGWLEALAPGARYVHIARNGLSVAKSIDGIATTSSYRMAFKPRYNQWWGTDESKWRALAAEGPPRGYYPDEVSLLSTHAQRAAYEWLCSLGEVDRHRDGLGERLLEITYTGLTGEPEATLRALCGHLGIGCPEQWLAGAVAKVRPERVAGDFEVRLPPAMRGAFDAYQARHGFEGRARALDEAGAMSDERRDAPRSPA